MKKFLSLALSLAMICAMSVTAFAAEDNEVYLTASGLTTASSDLTLEVTEYADVLVATVPLELPIVADSEGNVICSTDAAIVNNSDNKTLQVTEINVSAEGYYFCADGASVANKDNSIKLSFKGTYADNDRGFYPDGACTFSPSNWTIAPGESSSIDMAAELSPNILGTTLAKTVIGTVTFTLAIVE